MGRKGAVCFGFGGKPTKQNALAAGKELGFPFAFILCGCLHVFLAPRNVDKKLEMALCCVVAVRLLKRRHVMPFTTFFRGKRGMNEKKNILFSLSASEALFLHHQAD
jgi:hypothetical protein